LNVADDFFDMLEQTSERSAYLYDDKLTQIQVLTGHEADITALAYDAGNQFLVSGDLDGQIIIWNEKGEKVRSIQGHKGRVFGLGHSVGTKRFISAGADKRAILWSESGDSLRTFSHPEVVSSVIFLSNGEEFLTGSYDGLIRKWSVEGQILQEWKASTGTVETLALSPNGKLLISGHGGKVAETKCWNLKGDLQWENLFAASDESGGKAVYTVAFDDESEKSLRRRNGRNRGGV
jgi:WD40 repeat protein